MKKFVFIVLVIAVGVYVSGCGKKEKVEEELPQTLSVDTLSNISTPLSSSKSTAQPQTAVPKEMATVQQMAQTTASVPAPQLSPAKPTSQDIQTALKNAGYYTGAIDGKIGPKTKQAIIAFQAANSLEADGKVGPKTWLVLSPYLVPPATVTAPTETTKKR
jgi:peptidoglycan hydrolase-like protein with peptidoglycan-binding domain